MNKKFSGFQRAHLNLTEKAPRISSGEVYKRKVGKIKPNMKILGIDWGERRIGLAMTEGEIARPFGVEFTIYNSQFKIKKLCEKEGVGKIVIGISEGKSAQKTREFGQALQKITGLPVVFFDETLTTQEAVRKMVEAGTSQKKRREFQDAVSAALILQRYLDQA